MPYKKVNFRVVHASGEDDLHPSSELNSDRHGPLVQGWVSQKFCLFPSDLIIRFDKKTTLKKVQLLSHQNLIASKIEFYIGDCGDGEEPSYETAKYIRLGYVEMSSNEKTDFKARELKSVHVDAEGTFLKFVFHKNFVNRLNLYNQVGLVAINVIGSDFGSDIALNEIDADPVVLAAVKRPDYVSPLDDLAFAMYQDPEISQIIRKLDKKKSDCVIGERYDEAKKLKQAIAELYKIGERLARYDIERRQAIEEEDYERAKVKKLQMQEYRTQTYQQLQENNLLDLIDNDLREVIKKKASKGFESSLSIKQLDYYSPKELPLKELETERRLSSPVNSPRLNVNNKNKLKQIPQQQPQQQVSPPTHRKFDSDGTKPSTPYDDRVIPALRHGNKSRIDKSENDEDPNESIMLNDSIVPDQQQQQNGDVFEQEFNYDPMDGTEEMTEREVREAALMNDYLGKQVVTKLYSKNFQNREEAIQEVYNNLSSYAGDKEEAKALMRAAAILVAKMCKDNVFSVFNNSLRLFQFLVTDFAKRFSMGKLDFNYVLEKCVPVVLHRTGDTNSRLRQRAHEFIVDMANLAEIRPLFTVANICIMPIKLHIAPRLALSRVEIVEDLEKSLGTRDNGLTVENISKFCAHALDHTSGDVRENATKLLIQIYRENGNAVRKYLPPDNEMTRRNKKYRILFDAFDGIDGKPLQSYDRLANELPQTPRFNRSIKTPSKSKTPVRGTSMDRKTPMSIADESEYNPDNTCMFCGEVNEKFVKQGFEMHYWKNCPMLKQCNDCKQVIEIAVQSEHLQAECQFKSNYKKCARCSEAVNVTSPAENELHFKQKQCLPNDKKGNRCPLCHTNIGVGEEVWKEHLMSANGCTKNTRRNNNAFNAVPEQQNFKKPLRK